MPQCTSPPAPGLTLNANGTIGGTPTTAGQYTFTVECEDSVEFPNTDADLKTFTITIAPQ